MIAAWKKLQIHQKHDMYPLNPHKWFNLSSPLYLLDSLSHNIYEYAMATENVQLLFRRELYMRYYGRKVERQSRIYIIMRNTKVRRMQDEVVWNIMREYEQRIWLVIH